MRDKTSISGRAVLGVERSLSGRRWRARLQPAGEEQALAIVQHHGVPDLLARLLAARDQTAATAAAFLDPSLRDTMPDPSVLTGMEGAVARLLRAVREGEQVAVFGDYDVDGACAAALLAGFLEAAGARTAIHIPDRITEGYGPNEAAIAALQMAGASLLVTVDCGTTSFGPLAHAKTLGMDVVVVDHHQAASELPAVEALVNPNRQDDLSGLGHLCAAGVVFMVLVALNRALRQAGWWTPSRPAPDLLAELDLVALATVADVVPLVGLNRAFVVKGLAVMRQRQRPGLAALIDVAGTRGPPAAFHLGFLLGPRINAGGRIGRASLGAELLRTADPVEARRIAEQLDALNRDRRAIEAAALAEAQAHALAALAGNADVPVLLASGIGWHPGVVGLVAARLRERHERPAFAIAFDGEHGTGSGRSIPGVDLGRLVRAAVEAGLLVKGGGHAMAAGITLRRDQLETFSRFLDGEVGAAVTAARADAALDVDAALAGPALHEETALLVERAGPFGAGNPEPVFAVGNRRLVSVQPVGGEHLRLATQGLDGVSFAAVAFRAANTEFGAALKAAEGRVAHFAGHLTVSRWGGMARPELRLVDVAPASP